MRKILFAFTLFFTLIVHAQDKSTQKQITGKITDESNQPVEGATVLNKKTKVTTVADNTGVFRIAASVADELLITSVGYSDARITVSGQTDYSVQLVANNVSLNEVVVVGYGTQKRTSVTGAVSKVTAKVLENRPVTAVSTGLEGAVPGLTTTGAKGQPGLTHSEIRIRGVSTTNNANALVLIDGVPGDMNWINPDDIASVSVLKDAAAAAIYGSRASNGVILVTTKNGRLNDKPAITYSGYYGIQKPINLPKMLGSVEYMQMLNEAQSNVGLPKTYTDAQIETARTGADPDYFANTSWPKALIKSSAPQSNHNISVSGGSKDFNYYFSYGRLNQKGLLTGDLYNFDKNNARLKLNAVKLLDLIDVETNFGYLDRQIDQSAQDLAGDAGPIYTALTASPLTPVRFTTGTWGYGGGSSNPVTIATDGGFNKFTSRELTGNISATIHLLKNLSFRSQYGIQSVNQHRKIFSRTQIYYSPQTGLPIYTAGSPNSVRDIDYVSKLQNFTNQFDYSVKLRDHHIKVLAGYQQETFLYESFSASRTNLV
ncbi:MAG TPA: SusC/RagA family TonB-linked outer membrane protein, partial [Chitinophagaceae bacterium]|nr:SusC/RagA family TonB-linked outer membrane protein [Chitinophagaceae bacterium]